MDAALVVAGLLARTDQSSGICRPSAEHYRPRIGKAGRALHPWNLIKSSGQPAMSRPPHCNAFSRQFPGLFLIAASICLFTASRLKDAGSCIGG